MGYDYPTIGRRQVHCADGACVSVQASSSHYSWPRNDQGPYEQVEAAFPTQPPPASWMPYREEALRWPGCPDGSDSIYPYLPADYVVEFIELHGGICGGETPPLRLSSGRVVTLRSESRRPLFRTLGRGRLVTRQDKE